MREDDPLLLGGVNVSAAALTGMLRRQEASEAGVVVGVGIDLTAMRRIDAVARRPGLFSRFAAILLSPSERGLLDASASPVRHLARVWAVKEAVYKALPGPKPLFAACLRAIRVARHTSRPRLHVDRRLLNFPGACSIRAILAESDAAVLAAAVLSRPAP
ncbi:MAG: 4'-phosphopantetheinyl transferase superfamily protein [Deltaproteobacteria bacterium]|nr:4'-phosphopantetheinyl transferase superfamily protein [Deltaproteobacteria bacterium]